uniref:Nitrogen permease regulator 2-like protein-like n=1 Tax=Saccoglossus kowalevskii TaxID=10224 RepID=A0ABM0GVJ3_SACKO|nr:PREDICTED: nitrogen permease regulator 2-like protein-like [Saccoglossus kowalevskii]
MAGKDNKIKCIFFSEFHPVAGPKITYQVDSEPGDYISKEMFDIFHVYIITKPQLQNKLITVNALGHKIMGCSVGIENAKYSRNALLFNLCFVFDSLSNTTPYEPVVKKLASYLIAMELENGFISNEDSKSALPDILSKLLVQMNTYGKCSIQVNESNTIHLKTVSTAIDPPAVLGHHVPMFLVDKHSFNISQWDLTTQQLLPYIDGFNHVQLIAAEADVDLHLARMCMQNLLYLGIITLVPIFQFSNVYIPTPDINKLMNDTTLKHQCIRYVAKPGHEIPRFSEVFKLYCGLAPGITVKDFCARHNPHSLNVDHRKLIQFGVMKGLIRRLQKYPIRLPSTPSGYHSDNLKSLNKLLQGYNNYDEICCKEGMSHQELEEKIENDPHIVICWK